MPYISAIDADNLTIYFEVQGTGDTVDPYKSVFLSEQQGDWAVQVTNPAIVPGFAIPEYDTIVITEDATGETVNVQYLKDSVLLNTLSFTYSDHTFVTPYKTTTVTKS